MSPEEHLKLARRLFEEGWSKGNLDVVDECVGASYVGYDPAQPEPTRGIEALKQSIQGYRAAFPDLTFTIDEAYAAGADHTVLRWTARGTQQGALLGISPTGRSASVVGLTLSRIEGGKIVEEHTNWDTLGLLQQLGAITAPQPAQVSEQRPSAH